MTCAIKREAGLYIHQVIWCQKSFGRDVNHVLIESRDILKGVGITLV